MPFGGRNVCFELGVEPAVALVDDEGIAQARRANRCERAFRELTALTTGTTGVCLHIAAPCKLSLHFTIRRLSERIN